MTRRPDNPDSQPLMLPCEFGDLFGCDGRTVTRWANSGRIPAAAVVYTPGGSLRLRRDLAMALYRQHLDPRTQPATPTPERTH